MTLWRCCERSQDLWQQYRQLPRGQKGQQQRKRFKREHWREMMPPVERTEGGQRFWDGRKCGRRLKRWVDANKIDARKRVETAAAIRRKVMEQPEARKQPWDYAIREAETLLDTLNALPVSEYPKEQFDALKRVLLQIVHHFKPEQPRPSAPRSPAARG